jgi:hypothetical protein
MSAFLWLGSGTWGRLENEERLPSEEALAKLYEKGIDLNWLITGQGVMQRRDPDLVELYEQAFDDDRNKLVGYLISRFSAALALGLKREAE